MKKIVMSAVLLMVIFLVACGGDEEGNKKDSTSKAEPKGIVKEEDFDKMYTDPKKYKNFEVEFTGRVFVEPERDDDAVYLQIWADPENSEQNMIVKYANPEFKVASDDYVSVKGIVSDVFEGENAFGAKMELPAIEAEQVEVVDYITAIAPSIKTLEVKEEINQHGYIIHIDKIEFAENHTRLYVKIDNQTDENITFHKYDAKLIVGSQQLEREDNYEADYPDVQTELIAGTQTEGILQFPKVDQDEKTLKFYATGSSDNYDLKIEPFVFEITNN